jgi:hypothetical protein
MYRESENSKCKSTNRESRGSNGGLPRKVFSLLLKNYINLVILL